MRSAFPFEGLYSDFKKQYADGTFNKPKQVCSPRLVWDIKELIESNFIFLTKWGPFQIMYNFYASLLAKPPCICDRPMRLENTARPATDDTLVYTFNMDSPHYKVYRIIQVDKNHQNLLSVYAIKIDAWEPLYRMPSFGIVGCFKYKGECTEVEMLARCDVKGKAIRVGTDFLVTIPKIILDEAV